MPNRLYVRKFLNRRGYHGPAFVLLHVEDTSTSADPEAYPTIKFELSDCFRRIVLDFDLDSPARRRNSLYKARLLRDAVARFAEALEAEVELMDRRHASRRRTA